MRPAPREEEAPGAVPALGVLVVLLELLQNPALLFILGGPLGGLQAGGDVSLPLFGNLVASLGVSLVPLALLYVAPAVYAHALAPSRGRRSKPSAPRPYVVAYRFKFVIPRDEQPKTRQLRRFPTAHPSAGVPTTRNPHAANISGAGEDRRAPLGATSCVLVRQGSRARSARASMRSEPAR